MKKKLFQVLIAMMLVCLTVSGCNFEVDDSEERTYKGTVYDVAYSANKKDGLRSKLYYRVLISESENKVIVCSHSTAGDGRTKISEGTYEGDLTEKIEVKFDTRDDIQVFVFEDDMMRSEDGSSSYSKTDIKRAVYDVDLWD